MLKKNLFCPKMKLCYKNFVCALNEKTEWIHWALIFCVDVHMELIPSPSLPHVSTWAWPPSWGCHKRMVLKVNFLWEMKFIDAVCINSLHYSCEIQKDNILVINCPALRASIPAVGLLFANCNRLRHVYRFCCECRCASTVCRLDDVSPLWQRWLSWQRWNHCSSNWKNLHS